MKNRYLKNARIPERKVRELLNLFCEDLTATQIANISGVSRITVNAYLKLIRTQIAHFCEEGNPYNQPNGMYHFNMAKQSDVQYDLQQQHFYGIYKSEQLIYTRNLVHVNPLWLNNWIRGRMNASNSELENNGLLTLDAVADLSRTKLYRVNSLPALVKGKSKIDEIDLFWGIVKSRIVKFRGLNTGTTYLHIKESEFRYNNRGSDLFTTIHSLIQKRPLHFLKQQTAFS